MNGHTVRLWSPQARTQAHRLIDAAPKDAVVTVKPPKRTIDQNAKMWAMLTDISMAKPDGLAHTPDVWKAIFMNHVGHQVQFVMGLEGEMFPIGFRSSRLTKQQMSDVIEAMYEYGARHGVQWTEPEAV